MNKDTHKTKMRQLEKKLKIAEGKKEERELRWKIIKASLPSRPSMKFSKFIVVLCIAVIIGYTVAAILLQKNIAMEISPTLTTCVYTFFGSELLGMAGIKIFGTKYESQGSAMVSYSDETTSGDDEVVG